MRYFMIGMWSCGVSGVSVDVRIGRITIDGYGWIRGIRGGNKLSKVDNIEIKACDDLSISIA